MDLDAWLGTSLTPFLLASATLLAMVSLRNSDLATRSRACADELLYKAVANEERKAALRKQIRWFQRRYWLTSICFVCFAFTLGAFALSAYFIKQNGFFRATAQPLTWTAVALFTVGLFLLVIEFFLGPITLRINSRIK